MKLRNIASVPRKRLYWAGQGATAAAADPCWCCKRA